MDIVKKIVILIIVLVLAYFLSSQFGSFYEYFFPNSIGGGGIFSITYNAGIQLRGIPVAYIFFLTLLFTAFGGDKKYWWMGALLIPAVIFELYFDASHIYFPIALALAGSLLGFLLVKIASKIKAT